MDIPIAANEYPYDEGGYVLNLVSYVIGIRLFWFNLIYW